MAKNSEPLSQKETENCSSNLAYLIECVFPNGRIPAKSYEKNKTIPGLDVSHSTLNNARRGTYISYDTTRMIASAFSNYYVEKSKKKIEPEDLLLETAEFKEKFPESEFKKKEDKVKATNLKLFANKVYRGYYMLRNSSYKAYMAYFWFFYKNGKYSAAMLRGISNFDDVEAPFGNGKFDNIKTLKTYFKDNVKRYQADKSTASIHFYMAEHEDIRYSSNCIQINFHTEEADACYSTMYWNIDIVSKSNQSSYTGGSALMVDTNEGARGKDICAFKLGLECKDTIVEKEPLNNTAPQVIAELMPKTRNGILLIDNADDANWYRFINEKTFRNNNPDTFINVDSFRLIMNLANLENKYASKYEELNGLIEQLKKIVNPDKKSE